MAVLAAALWLVSYKRVEATKTKHHHRRRECHTVVAAGLKMIKIRRNTWAGVAETWKRLITRGRARGCLETHQNVCPGSKMCVGSQKRSQMGGKGWERLTVRVNGSKHAVRLENSYKQL
jgi:hypothetical protein